MDRGEHPHGHAEGDAEQGRHGGKLQGRRKHPADVLEHRVGGQHGFAEVAMQHVAHVHQELLP
jgi:hypothetical protein